MSNYEEYKKECEKIKAVNRELLILFENELTAAGVSDKTIRSHLENIEIFINEYLLREDAHPMEDGIEMIDMFLGDFFIRKCMWSTPGTIKRTAASIKKFYKCMLNYNKIEKEAYDFLCQKIKDNMEEWQEDCELYNNPGELDLY